MKSNNQNRLTINPSPDPVCFKREIEGKSGILIVHKTKKENGITIGKPNCGNFAKWIRENRKDICLSYNVPSTVEVLCANEVWLPFVQIATDTSLQLFINIVSNYLYDKSKGLLSGEKQIVHLEVEYEDKINGKIKRMTYDGDQEGLIPLMKRFEKI